MVYDNITRLISGWENPWLTALALLIHNDFIFMIIAVALMLLEERGAKRIKVLASVLIVVLLSIAIKEALSIERPCWQVAAKLACPSGFSLPSIHAAVAFTLAVAFVNKHNYWLYLAFALFVGLTRIYLGVHSFEDVAAGLVIAAIGYSLTDRLWRYYYEKQKQRN